MASIAPGSVVGGKYKLEAELLKTPSATLFAGRDETSGRALCVKVLLPMLARDREERGRFQREFDLMAKLKHQAVAQVFEMGAAEDGTPFMTMEAIAGEPLARRIERGALPPKDVLALTLQLLDGIRQAHQHQIVHRDIQPGSIFVSARPDGAPQVKIISFGQARTDERAGAAAPPGSALTSYGTTLGSAEYMAPEQARSSNVDGRADIYSLGCLVYAMLTGAPPFPGKQTAQVMVRHMKEEPRSPAQLKPGVPPWFDMWVLRCLRKAPDERFATAGEAREILENAMTTGFIPPPAHGSPIEKPTAGPAPEPVPSRPAVSPIAGRTTPAPVPVSPPRSTPALQVPRTAGSVPAQAAAAARPSAAGKPAEPRRVSVPAAPSVEDPDDAPRVRWPVLIAIGVGLGILLAFVIKALT